MSNKNQNLTFQSKDRLHVLGIDAEIDPVVGKKLKRGVSAVDRVHSLVMGFPCCGKSRFLLSLIKQRIDCGEGFMVLDSHSDLTQLVLSHIPSEQWDRVVYINPWSAFEDRFEKYINIERKMFADYTGDEYSVKVTSEQHEAATLLEQGFEWVGVKENLIFLRKRK